MSCIFRAYHAMQRQLPMSTRSGVPTAGTFVFVNMLNKLRDDFHPQYLAAVFDVAAPTFRDEQAKAIASVKKYDSKTQTYQEIAYGGYKANRKEMPHDLAQQLPYIRRALDAYRIPILEQPGFEADDVIGTLAHKANAAGHPVYVVSSDKDMLQLVGDLQQKAFPDSVLTLQAERCDLLDKLPLRDQWDERRYGRNYLLIWVKEEGPGIRVILLCEGWPSGGVSRVDIDRPGGPA